MKQNLEIEFKTFITKEKYIELINKFQLEGTIKSQTNHYFDTENLDLSNKKIVLRIRQKSNKYKLTSKESGNYGDLETHIELSQSQVDEMLRNGFNAKIINIPHMVHKICELTTHRTSIPYKSGEIFFDKSSYYGVKDYEIEFESESFDQGKIDFEEFLKENNISFLKSLRKSARAYAQVKKQVI